MEERHSRNIPALSPADMDRLAASHVLVAGCGGLGGNVIEHLARIGTGSLTVVDGDVFTVSNLNRQLLCTVENLGKSKALAAAERVRLIDPSISVTPVCEYLTEANAPALLADADIVIDCLDSARSRLMLENACADAGLVLVHGAIRGWELQAMLVPPGSGLLHELYADIPEDGPGTSLSFTPAACAAVEAALAVSYLCGHSVPSAGRLFAGDLKELRFGSVGLTSGDE